MLCRRLQLLPLFYFLFLHTSVSTFTGQFDGVAPDNYRLFDNNSASSKPRIFFLAFGRVEATVNVLIFLISILNIIVYKLLQLREGNSGEKLSNSSPMLPERLCRRFSLGEILLATNNFDESLVIGKGGFGITYQGVIANGTCRVAIKRLKPMSKQGAPEFWTEIRMLTKAKHCHVISLIGYCDSDKEMILVYEYMARGTFADHLYQHGGNGHIYSLPWFRRLEICIQAARGIDYLHTGTCDGIQYVIHRDLKSSNILLDDNWTAKISDFGFSTVGPTNTTGNNGTKGYRDPSHKLSFECDVYAFGVVLFEVLSGRRAVEIDFYMVDKFLLAKWAQLCIKEGKVDEIVDLNLKGKISQDCLSVFVQIANQCLDDEPEKRPKMAEVVIRLEYALALQDKENFDASGTYDRQEPEDSSEIEGNISDSGESYENQELEGSYVAEKEISNASGTCENQELGISSIVEEEIANASGTCDNQEEVLNANIGVHQDEKTEGNGKQSTIKAKRKKFTVKARIFLFGPRDR